ncbi:hypothetical protein GGS23DRAFT_576945 [Durotheca rogersii]|uniref:uncharacterized protein n=1 Tax=Durotheca rogersii TaxID=419775 RepID=UPI00221F50ED|nr:uncharacterized protein GGS23DRAFT_576945 [Durotheca rogersii]KAI5861473.1 hypothetical protein GGS23DRAFT_576945 [Durotheca rogersii]
MTLEHIRRALGFFWAADPLLSCLHPPHRRYNYYTQNIREGSALSHGKSSKGYFAGSHGTRDKFCTRYVFAGTRHGELPIQWRRDNRSRHHIEAFEATRAPGHYEPFIWRDHAEDERKNNETRKTYDESASELELASLFEDWEIESRIKRHKAKADDEGIAADVGAPYVSTRPRRGLGHFKIPVFTPEDQDRIRREFNVEHAIWRPNGKAEPDIGVFAGLAEIFSASSSCTLQLLHRVSRNERPNYNFDSYACPIAQSRPFEQHTVEFRQAAGTLDGAWVEVWARICVGLTHFAIHAPVPEYLSVMYHLHEAQAEGAPYNVIDLLDEVGLFAEAEFAAKRLARYKKEWGLKFTNETDEPS